MFARTLLLVALCALARADIVVENDLIIPEEIYDFLYSTDSTVWWQSVNTTKYYCIFRNMWTKQHHPKEYPPNARWGPIIMYSAVKEVYRRAICLEKNNYVCRFNLSYIR